MFLVRESEMTAQEAAAYTKNSSCAGAFTPADFAERTGLAICRAVAAHLNHLADKWEPGK